MAGNHVKPTKGPGIASAIVALIAMVMPNPTSKLCIAPGSHVAIEEIDSQCCASRSVPAPATPHSQNRVEATGRCGNCTDVIIAVFGREMVPLPQCAIPLPAGEGPRTLLSVEFPAATSRKAIVDDEALDAAYSSVPLRC